MGSLDDITHAMDDGGMQIPAPGIGTQQRPQLDQKNFGVIKGEAYPAPPQKWVGFSDGEKRQFLIATGVQGPDRHRFWSEGFQQSAIKPMLFILRGKRAARNEKNDLWYRPTPSYSLARIGKSSDRAPTPICRRYI